MATATDTLFVGATRPSLVWGVTYEAVIFCFSVVGIIFLITKNPFVLAFYVPIHGACYLICLKDVRFFRLLALWMTTKCKSVGWNHWGASTASPLICTRKQKRMPE